MDREAARPKADAGEQVSSGMMGPAVFCVERTPLPDLSRLRGGTAATCKTSSERRASERSHDRERHIRPKLPIEARTVRGIPDDYLGNQESEQEAHGRTDDASEYHHRTRRYADESRAARVRLPRGLLAGGEIASAIRQSFSLPAQFKVDEGSQMPFERLCWG
jgi:hypothetical protein